VQESRLDLKCFRVGFIDGLLWHWTIVYHKSRWISSLFERLSPSVLRKDCALWRSLLQLQFFSHVLNVGWISILETVSEWRVPPLGCDAVTQVNGCNDLEENLLPEQPAISSVGYGIDGRGLISSRGNTFFSSPQRPDRLWIPRSLWLGFLRE
jgi:hypothetical protein